MKRDDLFKFAMTAVCAAVLSACGSSGGDSKPSTGNTITVKPGSSNTAGSGTTTEKDKAEGEKDKGTTAEKDKAEGEKDKGTESTENKTPPANNDKVDDVVLQPKPEAAGPSNVGFKHVLKHDSNFEINTATGDNGADNPAALYVQNPFPSLDTIVVAEPLNADSQAPRGYLEDFDFRGTKAAKANETGKFTLKHIYLNTPTERTGTKADDATVSDARQVAEGLGGQTKTETKGKKMGDAYVYQDGRVNYTNNYSGTVYKLNEKNVYAAVDTATEGTADTARLKDGLLKGSVAEVYGYRTFAKDGDMANYNNSEKADFVDEEQPNLPLVSKEATHKAQLKNVQYGRVTTGLHGHTQADFKDGKNLGSLKTFVVNYGQFGDNMTEDHYFYRGINNVGSKAIPLSSLGGEGVLTYQGHAVSYGLDNNYMNEKDIDIPTAIGATMGLVSGNHVKATVNLKSKEVAGSIYNNWYISNSTNPDKIEPSTLVKFNGIMADNGNIAGNSVNMQAKTAGTFGATLFGSKGEEMGGVVASNDKTDGKRWGAVFGAIRSLPGETPNVVAPGKLQNGTGSIGGVGSSTTTTTTTTTGSGG